MKWKLIAVIAAAFLGSGVIAFAQQSSPVTAACGASKVQFNVKKDTAQPTQDAWQTRRKALVYFIEQMPNVGLVSKTVRMGVDGRWIGATKPQMYVSVMLDPGVHHLCASYEGEMALGEEGPIILHRLNVEPGKTYYMLYHGIFSRDSGEVAFFNEVDEDEGQLLLQSSDHAASSPKK